MLTSEQASHRNMSVRFTRRSPQGKWLRIETVDSYGNYVSGTFSPYILKLANADYDSVADRSWVERLNTGCIYEMIPDASGENVVQERAYDKDRNLIYIYTRTPIGTDAKGRRRYVGSYRDYLGRPAEMRPDSTGTYTYGTLVMLTEDRWGNDSVVEYMDARGMKKPNADGVAAEVYIYDRNGDCVMQQSRDAEGRPVIDNWSNCGVISEYVDHEQVRGTYVDTQGRPMHLQSTLDTEHNGVASIITEYDKYGRAVSRHYADAFGRPASTVHGIASVEIKYDGHGNMTDLRHYGADGRLHNNYQGYATQHIGFDSQGRMLSGEWLDSDGMPNQNTNYFSRRECAYDSLGNSTLDVQYEADGAKHSQIYRYERTPWGQRYTYRDGSSRIDSIDSHGRTTYIAFRDSAGAPELVGEYATAHHIYRDSHGITYNLDLYFDNLNRPTPIGNGYVAAEYVTDSVECTIYNKLYDANGHLFDSNIKTLSHDLSVITGQYDINCFGHPCRAGSTSQVKYYYADVISTQNSDNPFSALIGRDEFGEPDYIYSSWVLYYYSRNGIFYDEDNRPISDFDALRDALPKMMSVEVTDSAAYRLGLRDNDIIVADGVYGNQPQNSVEDVVTRGRWALACAMQPAEPRRMIVLRADTAARCYRPVVIDGVTGSPSDNGFLAHLRYLTKRQTARIREAIATLSPTDIPTTFTTGEHKMVFAVPDMYASERRMPYPREVTDPSVILSMSIPDLGMSWTMGEDVDTISTILQSRKMLPGLLPPLEMRVTKDGRHVQTLTTREVLMGVRILSNYIPIDIYQRFVPIAREAAAQSLQAAALPYKKLRGTYLLDAEPGLEDHSVLAITINKDGTYSLTGRTFAEMSDPSGAVIKLRIDIGTNEPLHIKGRAIAPIVAAEYHCTDIVNPPAGDMDELKAIVDNVLNSLESREQFMERITWLSPLLTPVLYLEPQPDGSLKARNTNGKMLNFIKIK